VDGLKSIPTKWIEPTALVMLALSNKSILPFISISLDKCEVRVHLRLDGRHVRRPRELCRLALLYSSVGTADFVAAGFNPPN
jgi:hypothetical protein